MAYNENLTNRVREALAHLPGVEEKKMFRGVTFMVNGKMCVSVGDEEIMCRIGPAVFDAALEQPGVREMMQGGRVMRGFVFVSADVLKTAKQLSHWINLALDFNQHAKPSKSPTKKAGR